MLPDVTTEVAFTNPGSDPTWTDISAYVKRASPNHGRDNELDRFGPGTNQLTLDNRDRRFEPGYTASPYYPNLLPMRRIRQRAPQQIGLEFWGDFEQGADGTAPEWTSGNGAIECKAGAEARQLSYVSSPTPRLGARIARCEVASGDQFGASTGERCLVRRGTQNNAFPVASPEGAVAFYQFSFRPLAPWTHPTGWEIFQEFKSDARYGQPIWCIETNQAQTNFELSVVTGNFPTAGDATAGTNASVRYNAPGPAFAADVWWDVRFAVKWTISGDGFFIWEMKQSTDSAWTRWFGHRGQTLPTTTGDSTPPSLNEFVGFYRNASAFTNVVFHDGYQVGHSWDDVSYNAPITDSRWNDVTWEGAPNILNLQGTNADGGFETGTQGVSATGGGITVSSDPTRSKFGSRSLKVVTDGGGSGQGVRHFKTGTTRFDVTAGKTYTFTQWYSCDTGETVRTGIEWFDSGGASISTSSALNKATRTDFRRHWVTATAPANAVTCRLESRWGGTVAGTFWVDGIGFWEGTLDHMLFDGYVDSWADEWPDRLFNSEVTISCTDGTKVLNLLAQPTSSPSVEDFSDVINFYEPSFYYRLGEPAGTRVISKVRKKKHKKYHRRKIVTAAEAEGISGPAGTYKNTPTLGVPGAISGDTDTAVLFANASTEHASIGPLDVDDFTGMTRLTVGCFAKLTTAAAGPFIAGPWDTPGASEIFNLGTGGTTLFFSWVSGGIQDDVLGAWTPTLGIWYFLVGTVSPSRAAVYAGTLGGQLTVIAEKTPGIGVAISSPDANPFVFIGRNTGGGGPNNIDAAVDEAFIIEAELTQLQLQSILDSASRGYNQEATGTRISNAIAAASFPVPTNLMAGRRQVLPVRQFGQPSLDPIDEAVAAEGGRSGFFFNAAGRATFLDRSYVDTYPYNTNQATFGDSNGEVPYEDVSYGLDEQNLYNVIRVEASGGTTQEASDGPSQTKYLARTWEDTGIPMVSDADAYDEAQWRLAWTKETREKFGPVTFSLGNPFDDGTAQQALVREVGDRITINRRPSGGTLRTQVSTIERVMHDIDFENQIWRTTYTVSPTFPPGDYNAWELANLSVSRPRKTQAVPKVARVLTGRTPSAGGSRITGI